VVIVIHKSSLYAIQPGASPGYSSRGGQKPEGGEHFRNTVLDVCNNHGAKREMGGARAPIALPLATALHPPLVER